MDDIKPIFDRIRWRLRVLAWRLSWLGPVLVLGTGCAHRQRIELAESIARRCAADVASASTIDEARAIAATCTGQLDAVEQEQRR